MLAFTAEDVKFSFHRDRGAAAKLLNEVVRSVDVLDAQRSVRGISRFVLARLPKTLTAGSSGEPAAFGSSKLCGLRVLVARCSREGSVL